MIISLFCEPVGKLEIKLNQLNLEITPETITTVIKLTMEIVEASKLKGEQQKKLITKIVRKVIVDAPVADDNVAADGRLGNSKPFDSS